MKLKGFHLCLYVLFILAINFNLHFILSNVEIIIMNLHVSKTNKSKSNLLVQSVAKKTHLLGQTY